jgi:hypothetical protein
MELTNLKDISFSENLKKIRFRLVPNSKNSIVINPYHLYKQNDSSLYNTTSTDIKLYRSCHDVDVDVNIDPIPVGNWDRFVFCDYKLYQVNLNETNNSWQKLLLNKFTNNFQPTKILHISLDEPGTDVVALLNTVQDIQINGKLVIEINDRTETVNSIAEARNLAGLFNRPEISLVYYWHTGYNLKLSYGLEISGPTGRAEYFNT